MQSASEKIQLTASQAACLDAVREGLDSKTKIAVETKQDLKTVSTALKWLDRARLLRRADGYRWRPTKRGRSCAVQVVPDPERRLGGKRFGELVAGSTAERLLDALDRPMRGAELAELLGVTKQRVHQLVVKLHAQGRLKLDDQGKVFHIVARSDDPTFLLNWQRKDGRYAGRVRLSISDDRSAESLAGFVESAVMPGTLVITDDWSGYASLRKRGYDHHAIAECGDPEVAEEFLPIIHLVFSNLKTWLNGIHHGVSAKHLQAYLNEFTFRFNRRFYPFNAFRSLLGIAGGAESPTFAELYSGEWAHPTCSGYLR